MAKSNLPPRLYKYCSPHRISVIESLELRFSRPTEFNDTFDTDYLITPLEVDRKARVEISRLRHRLGILCLTERPDDHLMWVNYAQNHTGFVVGFDTNAAFFSEEGRRLGKVIYQQSPPTLSEADIDACFVKSDVWQHEKEWRCVRAFDDNEQRNVICEPESFKEIIFGSHMETWQIARIVTAATAFDMQVEFKVSTPSKKSWAFTNMPKSIAFCEHCKGLGYKME